MTERREYSFFHCICEIDVESSLDMTTSAFPPHQVDPYYRVVDLIATKGIGLRMLSFVDD